MKIEKTTIYADEDLLLRRKADGLIFGSTLTLGYTYYLNEILLSEPKLEVPEDYEEVLPLLIENTTYYISDFSYAGIKTFVVKIKYSNDDLIALMLNYLQNPEDYKEKYEEMLKWRNYAGELANKYKK